MSDLDLRGAFAENLDFLGYDVYPMLHDEQRRIGGHAYTQALQLDAFRAYSGNFIVPEQASGFGSQPGFSTTTPEPGEMRRMAMSSVARGADGLMFFRWRPAHFGAEIYWMGIIDHDDVPRRRYAEAAQSAGEMARVHPLVSELPEGIELSLRTAPGRNLLFVQNTRDTSVTVKLPAGTDLLTGKPVAEAINLDGYGCAAIQSEAR